MKRNALASLCLIVLDLFCLGGSATQPAPAADVEKNLHSVSVLLPSNFLDAGHPWPWQTLSPEEAKEVFDLKLPAPNKKNLSIPLAEIIQTLTHREMIWIPRESQPAEQRSAPITYGSFLEMNGIDPKRPDVIGPDHSITVGQVLKGLITGSTEIGAPRTRYFGEMKGDEKSEEMIDVVVMTKQHIVILAVPLN